ncbi:phosphotransferase enzyme family protein [Streptomyces sp. WAC07149]|uniref:phosphotransferase enzyme family protein n=1 Tax=Streptomyces sp. WAC07149 TaxID=2487425 RepID=UPI0021AE88B8|nr:phosphotransferase [Streptomyces sp. WAC07149]
MTFAEPRSADVSAGPDGTAVAGVLALRYRIAAAAVGGGPAGTVTRNYLVEDREGRRWFVKSYPPGTDLAGEREALALGEAARAGGVPVPAVLRTVAGEVIASGGGLSVSVAEYVADAETAEGGLSGGRWAAVGEAVGLLHRVLAGHPAGPPRHVPAREVCDVERAGRRLRESLGLWAATPPPAESFAGWAHRTAARRLDVLPEVAARLDGLPATLTAQVVHGDLASPNLLLRGPSVAALIDFRPPRRRSAAWELGRIVLDPRTVLARPDDWIPGLARAVDAYRAANPGLPAEELVAVPRITAGYLGCSVYPLSVPLHDPAALTPALEAYGRARHEAATVLWEGLEEAEGALRDLLL